MPDLVDVALADVGKVPYSYGAPLAAMFYSAGLRRADCSSAAAGWVQMAYGITIPRTADVQFKATKLSQLVVHSPADIPRNSLLFMGRWPSPPTNAPGYAGIQHVGVGMGDGAHFIQEGSAKPNVNVARLSDYWSNLIAVTAPFGGIMREFDIIDQTPRTIMAAPGDPRIAAIPIDGSPNIAGISGMTFSSPAQVKLRIPVNSTPNSQIGFLTFHGGKLVLVLARNSAAVELPGPGPVHATGTIWSDGSVTKL